MRKSFDLIISFQLPELKLFFEHLYLEGIRNEVGFNIRIQSRKKEKIGKEFVYSGRSLTIDFYSGFIHGSTKEKKTFFESFRAYLHHILSTGLETKYLLKIIFHTTDKKRFVFLFEVFKAKEVSALLTLALEKVIDYENSESVISKQIKFAYRLESRKFYFKIENNQWELLDIVFEAGRMHHSHIPSEIKDKRIHKTEIWLHKDDFTKRIYHRNRWALKVGKRQYVRLRPNDIALYSNIVEKNLDSARQVYNDNNSGIWDAFPVDESETIMLDYFENIITAIIFAYTTIETLINICIPFNYVHTKTESNKKTKKKLTVKHSKEHIERWYTLVDKLSEVLPKALDIPSPKQEKWWFNFTQLKDIRNKIVHAVESQSNERYSELLDRQIFDKISSYKQVLDFIGRHLYEQKHFLLNQIPYGLGYDDIRPSLIGDDIYDDF